VKVLLDTCCFLWLALEPSRLSATAATAVNNPGNNLLISDASIWEIALKYSTGKLPLPAQPRMWIPQRLAFFQIRALPISHDVIFRSTEFPRVHNDPFDRLIAAQALEENLQVLSPDKLLDTLGVSRLW
jgi:PIN domain nuclease of toxin-antitoxin system